MLSLTKHYIFIILFQEKQTNVVLAQAIYDTHQEFGLGNKVVATTTDNGTNYVAAFKYFGASDVPVEGGEEQDPEVVVGQPANLHAQLEEVVPAMIKLPKHYRCRYVCFVFCDKLFDNS